MGQKISLPAPGLLGLGFAIDKRSDRELIGVCSVWLPGMPIQQYRWGGDPLDPEEMAAFYDDVTHTLRVEHRILTNAIEELTRVQLPLF